MMSILQFISIWFIISIAASVLLGIAIHRMGHDALIPLYKMTAVNGKYVR